MWVLVFLMLSGFAAAAIYWNKIAIALPFIVFALITMILNKSLGTVIRFAAKEFIDRNKSKAKRVLRRIGLAKAGERLFNKIPNPKPFSIGDFDFDDIYLVTGTYSTPLQFSVAYSDKNIQFDRELEEYFLYLSSLAERKAKETGATYFNGPNARLIRVTNDMMQNTDGSEQRLPTLELGPVSWFEYNALNGFMDHRLKSGNTIREVFASVDELYKNAGDFRWCKLSNIISMAMLPITSDGYGLVQHRSFGVSADPGRYTSGVAECIHRYLDEAPKENLGQRRAPLLELYDKHGSPKPLSEALIGAGVDENYSPSGVPSPLLAAKRGLFEEVSEELYELIPDTSYRFLNIAFGISGFHPNIVGIIDLNMPKHEVEKIVKTSPGRDHHECTRMEYVPLDVSRPDTEWLLRHPKLWTPGGLAALVSAIHWQSRIIAQDTKLLRV